MAQFEGETCYQCDAQATGREHVPPKCLFPKGSNWPRLMTVPSCVTHNSATSKADEYLKFLLGAIASHIPDAIRSSVARGAVRLAKKRSRDLHRYGLEWEGDALSIDKPIPLDFELLSACLKKIARALYFYHHRGKRKLLFDLQVWPLFIPVDPKINPRLTLAVDNVRAWSDLKFEQWPKFGSHQEIFAYQITEEPNLVIVNMEFYGAQRAAVMGSAGSATTREDTP